MSHTALCLSWIELYSVHIAEVMKQQITDNLRNVLVVCLLLIHLFIVSCTYKCSAHRDFVMSQLMKNQINLVK